MTTSEIIEKYSEDAWLSPDIRPYSFDDIFNHGDPRSSFMMAPMAGVSDAAYRLMARAAGASLGYSEMVSVAGLHFSSDKTWDLVLPDPAEPTIAVQLFGSRPEQFKEAAEAIQKRLGDKLVLIDINMACPVPKVTKKGEGSALLDTPELAAEIVRATISGCQVPVTVKIRSGRRKDQLQAPDFAVAMERAGVSAIAVHGRSASQLYTGQASWDVVSAVKRRVSVPVIGSGDVLDAQVAAARFQDSGAQAIFCARGTYGDPWIFKNAALIAEDGEPVAITTEMRMTALMAHVRLLEATGANLARARSLAGWYVKGIPGAAYVRGEAVKMNTADEFCRLAEAIRDRSHEIPHDHE